MSEASLEELRKEYDELLRRIQYPCTKEEYSEMKHRINNLIMIIDFRERKEK